MVIKIVEMNNKSRKGTYIYVKEKGVRSAYFKYDYKHKVDLFKNYYKDKYVKKKVLGTLEDYKKAYDSDFVKGKLVSRTAPRRQAEQYLRKIKKRPTVEGVIGKGINSVIIDDIIVANNGVLVSKVKELLKPMVYDNDLLDILVTPENLKKIPLRFEYRISYKDSNNKTLATSTLFANTPEQMFIKLKNVSKVNEEILLLRTPQLAYRLKNIGATDLVRLSDGKVKKCTVKMIFRKGK